jgi:hypothetical protein
VPADLVQDQFGIKDGALEEESRRVHFYLEDFQFPVDQDGVIRLGRFVLSKH